MVDHWMHGYGKFTDFNSDAYEGEWEVDKRHGHGT